MQYILPAALVIVMVVCVAALVWVVREWREDERSFDSPH